MSSPATDSMYALQEIPGKGKGLVATRHIPKGTRILCEEPLFAIPNVMDLEKRCRFICQQVDSLSNEQRQAFLSMHNIHPFNDTEERDIGIFETNSLPAGGMPIPHTRAIFLEACRINHDCKSNAIYDWNTHIKRNTVHAVRDINEGEEITVSYVVILKTRESRQRTLKNTYHFTCRCSLCSLPNEQSQERDRKIAQIVRLGEFYVPKSTNSPPQALGYVDAQARLYNELYQEDCGHPYSYQYAVMIARAHGDLARIRVFAQRVVRSFVTILGTDSTESIQYANMAKNPASEPKLLSSSTRWKTSVNDIPQGLGPDDFEDWLWRREPVAALAQPMSPPSQSLFSGFADLAYKNGIDAAGCFQSRHSCFLAEIVETLVPHPLDLKIRDILGKTVQLHFYTKGEGTELEPSQYQRGHTVAVLNASQYVFEFGPRGIRQTDLEMTKVNTIAEHGLFCINLSTYPRNFCSSSC
ncbi:hypothetical protein E4U60_003810 [Claviceps pazoutovae]|uniref:SET domain-containing protein n=1 Tax=Claviceps pazoutovae TaxID=1649127 RepID=A0A9P7SF03_9HYPO|nr:hypothetical protein E4U60_003810 [Claviceps pazoutovae]